MTPGTPAAEAGLKTGECVSAINGTKLTGLTLVKVLTMVKSARGDLTLSISGSSKSPNVARKAAAAAPPATKSSGRGAAVAAAAPAPAAPAAPAPAAPAPAPNAAIPVAVASQIDVIVSRVTAAAKKLGITVSINGSSSGGSNNGVGGDYTDRLRALVEQLEAGADSLESESGSGAAGGGAASAGGLARLVAVVTRLEAIADARGLPSAPTNNLVPAGGGGNAMIRLATVTASLEKTAAVGGSGVASTTTTTTTTSALAPAPASSVASILSANPDGSGTEGAELASVAAFDELMRGPLYDFLEKSAAVGGAVGDISTLLRTGFIAQRRFLEVAPQSQKPGPKVLPLLIEATSESVAAVVNAGENAPRGDPKFNHLKAVAEAVPALGWIVVEGKPVPFIRDFCEASAFYANRVIKDNKKESPADAEWAKSLNALFSALSAYVKAHHTTGVTWGKKMRSMTFWSNAIAMTAPGEGDADKYIYSYKLGMAVTAN